MVEKPDIIAYALQNFENAEKQEICMIGDRKYDVAGAKANGYYLHWRFVWAWAAVTNWNTKAQIIL